MNSTNSLQFSRLGLCLALLFSGTAIRSHADELPVLESKAKAIRAVETRLMKGAQNAGVKVKDVRPLEPVLLGEMISIGVEVEVSGTLEQVMKFLGATDSIENLYHVPTLNLTVDRKDPSIVNVQANVVDWYASSEKAERSVEKWIASRGPQPSTVESFATCAGLIGTKKVSFVTFESTDKTITFSGESENMRDATGFVGMVFREPTLDHYDWVWMMRPRRNLERDDGSFEFSVWGRPKKRIKKSETEKKPGDTGKKD